MDGETKKKVVPQLMPRALFWFRWGAAYTWVTGILLLGLVFYMQSNLLADLTADKNLIMGVGLGGVIVGFVVYDALAKALAKQPMVSLVIWWAIALGFAYALEEMGAASRASYVHVGALLGTSMAANVWMRIWPAQRRIIAAVKAGQAPDPADPALAGLRSKHNTFMSVPLLLTMLNQHLTLFTGGSGMPAVAWLAAAMLVSLLVTQRLYATAAKVQGF
jgi:uncharacterized membrane protein